MSGDDHDYDARAAGGALFDAARAAAPSLAPGLLRGFSRAAAAGRAAAPEPPEAAEPEVADVLGDDIEAIRARVAALAHAQGASSEEANAALRRMLEQRIGVDLDREENLEEDPALVERMRVARDELARHEACLRELPGAADLQARHVAGLRRAATVARELEQAQGRVACAGTDTLSLAAGADRLATGTAPHGFSAVKEAPPPEYAAGLQRIAAKLRESAATADSAAKDLAQAARELTLYRRETEAVTDGLLRLLAYYEKATAQRFADAAPA